MVNVEGGTAFRCAGSLGFAVQPSRAVHTAPSLQANRLNARIPSQDFIHGRTGHPPTAFNPARTGITRRGLGLAARVERSLPSLQHDDMLPAS
jgi:hypothetical protein